MQILLDDNEYFDEALNLLDQASFQPDVLLYNTILRKAGEKVFFWFLSLSPCIFFITVCTNTSEFVLTVWTD